MLLSLFTLLSACFFMNKVIPKVNGDSNSEKEDSHSCKEGWKEEGQIEDDSKFKVHPGFWILMVLTEFSTS